MNRYTNLGRIGTGAFGDVYKMENKQTGEFVAVKRIKRLFKTWEECMQLRELASLRQLKQHPNIVQLKEIVREQQQLNFVFEFMIDGTLLNDMQKRKEPHSEAEVRHIMRQVLAGLEMCHKNNFFHRDIKPENLLMAGNAVKIADFGCAREIRSRPPFTDYVSTRWYRAPELLLRSTVYNSPVDMWACGCIMAELFAKRNLFPGKNDIDTLFKIVNVLGTPSAQNWPEGCRMAKAKGINFPSSNGIFLGSIMSNASDDALRLMTDLLQYDSNKRPSAVQALNYPFFTKHQDVAPVGRPVPVPVKVPQSNSPARTGAVGVFELGQRVEGRYGGRDNWYPGTISAKRMHDVYDIEYADGDKESEVHAALIRNPSAAKAAAPAPQTNARQAQNYQPTYQPVTLGQYSQQHTYPAASAAQNRQPAPSSTYSGGGGSNAGVPAYQHNNASKWQNYGKQPAANPGPNSGRSSGNRSANRSGARDSAGRRKIGVFRGARW